ncbi:hypothetical protein GDO86_000765 [Hymenochirus boettgeri]|uniref:PPM-type phosphatase domain-containing protein n=1 Tax=Hymenochirus boettgeri TaxID=247094 RepID=A0A8T2K9T5_9PIPI|nr:hypothetical protein GDO86_000765 [Hymenochirus boettgeri]
MSSSILITFARNGWFRVNRTALVSSDFLQDKSCNASTKQHFTGNCRSFSSRFDLDGSGHPVTWDTLGIWDNKIDQPIQLPPSIKYGKLIPKSNLSKVGYSTLLGKRKENEDRFHFGQLTKDVLYFAVFDGHGGASAAEFCNKFMEKYIK